MKITSIVLAVLGAVAFVIGLTAIITALNSAPSESVGIIGGADAPTFEFMTHTIIHSWAFVIAVLGIAALIASVVIMIAYRNKRK